MTESVALSRRTEVEALTNNKEFKVKVGALVPTERLVTIIILEILPKAIENH